MDSPFRPPHIDGGALYLHRRYSNNRGSQTKGSLYVFTQKGIIFLELDGFEIADSRYQSIYNPTTDEWILQVMF